MSEKYSHRCDDRCGCPEHGKQLLYWPAGNEHACPDPGCRYAHGYEAEMAREYGVALLGAMAGALQKAADEVFPALKRFGEAITVSLPSGRVEP